MRKRQMAFSPHSVYVVCVPPSMPWRYASERPGNPHFPCRPLNSSRSRPHPRSSESRPSPRNGVKNADVAVSHPLVRKVEHLAVILEEAVVVLLGSSPATPSAARCDDNLVVTAADVL